jgi:formylglycine-generating enzyme required for sulfatase activity
VSDPLQAKDPSTPNFDPEALDRESPVHKVYLDAYRIGKYPVTVGEYRRFVQSGGYQDEQFWAAGGFGQWKNPEGWDDQIQHPNRPVTGVSWHEASAYAAWAGCRLPTEAEWERAARGPEGRKFPWGNDQINPSLANYGASKIGSATPVGVYPRGATPDGILDMAGNVWEWCQDWWSDAYTADDVTNPTGPQKGDRRVVRGGCWFLDSRYCRCACRYRVLPPGRYVNLGFRLVVVLAARTQKRKP